MFVSEIIMYMVISLGSTKLRLGVWLCQAKDG